MLYTHMAGSQGSHLETWASYKRKADFGSQFDGLKPMVAGRAQRLEWEAPGHKASAANIQRALGADV